MNDMRNSSDTGHHKQRQPLRLASQGCAYNTLSRTAPQLAVQIHLNAAGPGWHTGLEAACQEDDAVFKTTGPSVGWQHCYLAGCHTQCVCGRQRVCKAAFRKAQEGVTHCVCVCKAAFRFLFT